MGLINEQLAVYFGCKRVKSLSPSAVLGLWRRNGLLDGGDGGRDGLCGSCSRDWLVGVVSADFAESGAGLVVVWHGVQLLRGDASIV
jgi:hypothetical protein